MSISIIIFCHNEGGNIERVLGSVLTFLIDGSYSFEIILVDDGSTDDTKSIVAPFLQNSDEVRYIRHEKNAGIGMALRSGYAAARNEYVCAIPGDGQFDINDLSAVTPFSNDSFYSFYRPKTNYTAYRLFLNHANRQFNRWLLGIKLEDVNWIKVYRKEQLAFVNVELRSSIVESEICAKLIKAGSRPIELPSVYHERKAGTSQGGNWKTLKKALLEMFSLVRVTYRFKKHF